jgi:phenylpropionate dioxygenase-like ring-hydroxylating dioxygenase large terminal subunit
VVPAGLDMDAIEAGLAAGYSIPAKAYTAADVLADEFEHIFDRSWQYVGHAAHLREPGDYVTGWAGRIGAVVLRDATGDLRAYVNVCAHRGHEVAQGCGRRQALQCRYHGWTYGLDGRLRAAPRADRAPEVDLGHVALRPMQVDTWGPLVFVNADPTAPPLADTLGDVPALAASRGLRFDDHPPRTRREWPIAANWKVTLDNNTECYHCATIHPGFASGYHVDADSYEVTTFARSFSHRSPSKTGGADFHLYYVWPNFMLSARGNDHYYVYVYRPVGAAQTLQVNEYFYGDRYTEAEVEAEVEALRGLMAEDWAAFESVQRGLASGSFDRGLLLGEADALLRGFHSLWVRSLR